MRNVSASKARHLAQWAILPCGMRFGTILRVTLQQDMTNVLEALFDIRANVSRIVSILEEEDDGEQGDEEEDS